MTITIRRIARLWSVASVGFVLLFLVGEGFHPSRLAGREWLGLLMFPFGVCAGLIVAWRREGLGGALAVASILLFYAREYAITGAFPRGWAFLAVAAPGFLFLAARRRSSGPSATQG